MEKNEKNGVFSRVRSRWRSIFSKKPANPVKLRDCNRLTFERILSDPDEQIGTILAQATVEPITLPNSPGISFYHHETTIYEEDDEPKRRLRRLSSGDLNVIRRMTEEINFDLKLQNVVYDGNEITGETDEEKGNDRACFKPGPDYPTDQQMMFLKQCLKKTSTRPPNIYYLTNGWSLDNFEALFKYMIRSTEDCLRDTYLSIEFRDCIVSLQSLYHFIEQYANFKGVVVQTDYVYATVHSKKASREKKMRGAIEPFVEVESKVRKTRISYTSTFQITSPNTPNVMMIVRFCCQKPCRNRSGIKKRVVSVQVDHVTGHRALQPIPESQKQDGLQCECVEDQENPSKTAQIAESRPVLVDDEEVPVQLSYHIDQQTGDTIIDGIEQETSDGSNTTDVEQDIREYVEMFPTILELFSKAGLKDSDESDENEDVESRIVPMTSSDIEEDTSSELSSLNFSQDSTTSPNSEESNLDDVKSTSESGNSDSEDSENENEDVKK